MSNDTNAIEVKNISKVFKIHTDKPTTLKEKMLFLRSNKFKQLPILNNISFEVKSGEMVGLVGHNGSGKSTLLKLLTKIIYPDHGSIVMNGRVSSLLELGAGFHPDFTGFENIYMNASIFGLTKKEIEKKIHDIIQFSELKDFIHSPVRTYSSGMYMRLAFATAINVEPDILLVDEVLAVGDASFQRKCLNRIKELKNNGKTIVLVTHDHGVVERMCDRAIWLHNGTIKESGKPKTVINTYLEFLAQADNERLKQETQDVSNSQTDIQGDLTSEAEGVEAVLEQIPMKVKNRWGNKYFEIIAVRLKKSGEEESLFHSGDAATIEVDYVKCREMEVKPVFGIAFHTLDKIRVYGVNTQIDDFDPGEVPNKGTIQFHIPRLNLVEGDFEIDVAVHDENGLMFDYIAEVKSFRVISDVHDVGLAKLDHEWKIFQR